MRKPAFRTIERLWLLTLATTVIFLTYCFYLNHSFDIDEWFSISVYQNIDIRQIPLQDFLNLDTGNPPLFFWLAKMWTDLFGKSEIYVRILPTYFFVASTIVFWKIAQITFKSSFLANLAAMTFVGLNYLSPMVVYFRAYTLLLLLSLMTVFLSIKLEKSSSKSIGVALALCVIIGSLSHYFYFLFVCFWFSSLVIVKKLSQEKIINQTLKYLTLGSIFTSPLFIFLLLRQLGGGNEYDFIQKFFLWSGPSSWLFFFSKIPFLSTIPNSVTSFIWILFFCLMIKSYPKLSKNQKLITVFTAISWTAYLFTPLHTYLSLEKYWWFVTPYVIISLFILIETVVKKSISFSFAGKALLLTMITLWSLLISNKSFFITLMDEDWKQPISALDGNEILITNCLYEPVIKHYLFSEQKNNQVFSLVDESCALPLLAKITTNSLVIGRHSSEELIRGASVETVSESKYKSVFLQKVKAQDN